MQFNENRHAFESIARTKILNKEFVSTNKITIFKEDV
jgi:hypothetical protein